MRSLSLLTISKCFGQVPKAVLLTAILLALVQEDDHVRSRSCCQNHVAIQGKAIRKNLDISLVFTFVYVVSGSLGVSHSVWKSTLFQHLQTMLFQVFLECFSDPNRVPRIENRVPRIREIGSLQVHTGYLTFCLKNLVVQQWNKGFATLEQFAWNTTQTWWFFWWKAMVAI